MYITEDFNEFSELLKNKIVQFEYKKKDGSIRRASGTMNQIFLHIHTKPKKSDIWKIEQEIIEILLKEHDYSSLLSYAFSNDLSFIGVEGNKYVFSKLPTRSINQTKQKVYFDIVKNETRSFLIDNFLGVIAYSDLNFESN